MRLTKLAMTALFGAVLALPAMAQTTPAAPAPATTAPATTAPAKPAMTTTAKPAKPTATPAAMTGPINLNTATPDQLDTLPGIGQKRAKKIVAARPFKSVDELDSKKVVPHSVFEKIKDKVTI